MSRENEQMLHGLQQEMEVLKSTLDSMTVAGMAESGKVRVSISGMYRAKEIRIAPELLNPDAHERLQSLVITAFNDAVGQVSRVQESMMQQLSQQAMMQRTKVDMKY